MEAKAGTAYTSRICLATKVESLKVAEGTVGLWELVTLFGEGCTQLCAGGSQGERGLQFKPTRVPDY